MKMTPHVIPQIRKWPGIRVGILSLIDLKGDWTAREIQALLPPPKRSGNLNETLLRGSISTSSDGAPSSSLK